MSLENYSVFKLEPDTDLKPFDCDDEDLNDFLFKKSKNYHDKLLATTFIIEDKDTDETVAYFSILNDNLLVEEHNFFSKKEFQRFKKVVPHPKRHLKSFPAIKIGRLAVSKKYQGLGLGKEIINVIKYKAVISNKNHACKFITLDAYSKSLSFYEKVDFQYLTESDKGEDTRQMYFDLTPFSNI